MFSRYWTITLTVTAFCAISSIVREPGLGDGSFSSRVYPAVVLQTDFSALPSTARCVEHSNTRCRAPWTPSVFMLLCLFNGSCGRYLAISHASLYLVRAAGREDDTEPEIQRGASRADVVTELFNPDLFGACEVLHCPPFSCVRIVFCQWM